MFKFIPLLLLAFLHAVTASDCAPTPTNYTYPCGSVNIFFTGFPHDHPNVTAAGFDPKLVLKGLKTDAAAIIAAGYNLRVAFLGPEKGLPVLEEFYRGVPWTGAIVGYGVRGSSDPSATFWFSDVLNSFRVRIPRAQLAFNYSPTSTLIALRRQFPLPPNCPPGRDYGYTEVCDRNVCPDGGNTTIT